MKNTHRVRGSLIAAGCGTMQSVDSRGDPPTQATGSLTATPAVGKSRGSLMVCGVRISSGERWPVLVRLTTKVAHLATGAHVVVPTAPPCSVTNQTIDTTGGLHTTHEYRDGKTTVAIDVVWCARPAPSQSTRRHPQIPSSSSRPQCSASERVGPKPPTMTASVARWGPLNGMMHPATSDYVIPAGPSICISIEKSTAALRGTRRMNAALLR